MKALILSGGKGSRLRPLTHTSAKQLLPIANKPIIYYGIESIAAAGIKDFAIIVGDTAEDVIREVGDGSRWGINITYIHQDQPLGLAHAVKISRDYMKDEPFIMYLGDNMIKEGIPQLVKKFKTDKPNSLILLTKVPNPQQFGVAELDPSGKIVRLVEKPEHTDSDLALVGVYLFDKNIFKAVDSIKPSARGELEITDAISWLLANGYKVEHHVVTGWWKDTGKPSDILEANQLVLQSLVSNLNGNVDRSSDVSGSVVFEEGSKVESSTVRGPVIIGKNSRIINSYIGPFTSISNDVVIEKSEIENSIIMEGVCISGIRHRIDESIIGKGVQIISKDAKPETHKFIIGDKSEVVLA